MSVLGILAITLAVTAYGPYVWEVLRGHGRPNRASWAIFAATGLFAAAAAWAGGSREGCWVPLVYGILSSVVFVISLKRGEGGWSLLDRGCLATAVLSLAGWWISGDPLVCVAMNALADTAGHLPTIRKAWRAPKHEPILMWVIVLSANLCNLAALSHWTLIEALYPLSLTWNAAAVIVGWSAGRLRGRGTGLAEGAA